MGYSRSYGMSGTAVPEWQQGLKKCKETMSCTAGRCMSYDGASNKCTCEKCSSLVVNGSKPNITPRYSTNNTRPPRYVRGMNGLSAPKQYYLPGGAGGQSDELDKQFCAGKMSCTPGNCRVISRQTDASNPAGVICTCKPCNRPIADIDGVMVCPPGHARRCHNGMCWCSKLVPGTTSVERLTAGQMPTVGVNGLGANFLDSVGNLANLAIIGLAIYGGFCLAKKL